MSRVILYKGFNPNEGRNGSWFWSDKDVSNDFYGVYTEPYVVEIPDEFECCESASGEEMYYKDGVSTGFRVGSIRNVAHCVPYLVGTGLIKLRVLGLADKNGDVDFSSIKSARIAAGLSQKEVSDALEIPIRTIESWELGLRKPPEYVEKLIIEKINSMAKRG